MDSRQNKIILGSFALVLFAWLISPLLLSRHEQAWAPNSTPLSFDGARAFTATKTFVTQNPIRVLGSLESRAVSGFIHDRLTELGYTVTYSHFDARIAWSQEVGRNILCFKQGSSPEILVLVAHYDSAGTAIPGAMDNGSGVGVLLELARVFAEIPTRRSLLLAFTDAGEWGSLGAADIAEGYAQRNPIAAVLSLDHVGTGDLRALCLEETGQLKGFTPPWLRQLARHAAETQGLPVVVPSAFGEHFERAILISNTDQGPFLRAKIPAVNLGSISMDRAREEAVYHTPQDTIANLKATSFQIYGNAAERIVRTLDELQAIPPESSASFRLWDALYVSPRAIHFLHLISFLPLLVILFYQLKDYRKRMTTAGIMRELLVFLGTILPFWAILFFIGLARALRQIPLYSLYPATAKDPVLLNPPWNVLGIILGAALVAAIFFYIIGNYSVRELPKPDFHVSKIVLLSLLLIVVAVALHYNSYWATAFLLLPAWIWSLVDSGQTLAERMRNMILILAAGIPCYAAEWIYASRLEMNWNFVWYQVLALSTGLFSPLAYLLGTAAVALGVRLLVLQFRKGVV